MALTASGQISFSDINTELGQSSDAQLSLSDAAQGNVVTINTNSENTPDSSAPHSISEWYSYDHSASGATYNEWTGDGPHPNSDNACEVSDPTTSFYHDGTGGDPVPGDTVYTDSGGSNIAGEGYYRTGCCYIQVDDSGVVTDDTAGCGR